MGWIRLERLAFHAYHGVYEHEKKKGAAFLVDVEVKFPIENLTSDDLTETVNYEEIALITKKVMQNSSNLLEHIALSIGREVRHLSPAIETVRVKVSKKTPPLDTPCEWASAEIEL